MVYDLIIIGGGINGVGIARDAAGRGLRVLLCEQDDLASHTSSASTKLIHGGLRYLEHYEFSLVHKALQEREILLRIAPHIISPLNFVMPYVPHLRPAWMIRAGLFLYDILAQGKSLPSSQSIALQSHLAGVPLQSSLQKAFIYSDARVDDARLVALNARDAADRGATILTRTKCISAERHDTEWICTLQDQQVRGRILVNAAGPWVHDVLKNTLHIPSQHSIRLVKGSHIVTRRLFDHEYAYIFQNPDKRVVFAIPYESEFTLMGTTDIEYNGDPSAVTISEDEINYLCDSVNSYFKTGISPKQIIWSYAGVRPLLEEEIKNPSAVTRDYRLELDQKQAPLLSIFGGKITTYRRLAEEALELLGFKEKTWTARSPLPGGDISNFSDFLQSLAQQYPWLPTQLAERYAHAYGTRIHVILKNKKSLSDLGEDFGHSLYEAEIRYLIDQEWAISAEDILWRRSKLGLHINPEHLQKWLNNIS